MYEFRYARYHCLVAFVPMGARFVNVVDIVGQYTDENNLAAKLNGKTWE